jgi:Flp pilus assembly protein TadG
MTGQRPGGRPVRPTGCCVPGRPGPGNARGAVTAEFAVALPAVLLLLALLLAGAAAGATQLRLEEAALAGARALARGESPAAAEAIVSRLAGASATAALAADGEWVSVTVADRVAGPLGSTVPWTLTARATTRSETAGARGPSGAGMAFPKASWLAAVA